MRAVRNKNPLAITSAKHASDHHGRLLRTDRRRRPCRRLVSRSRGRRRTLAHRDDGRPDHEHRGQHRRRPGRRRGHRARGHELAHVRTATERRRAAVDGRRRLHQRPAARGTDAGARRGQPRTTARRSSSSASRRSPRTSTSTTSRSPRTDGKPNPHLWTNPPLALRYAEIVRDDMSARDPDNADYYAANYAAFAALIDELDAAMRDSFATVPERKLLTYHDAYAYFAEDVRLGRDRRDPGVGLRGSDTARGRRPDRAGRSRGRAGDLRVRGVPQPGARADRSGSGRRVRRRAARRRPARRARRRRALVARPDAVRLHHDGRRRSAATRPRWRPSRSATSPPTRPSTRSDFRGRLPRAGPARSRVVLVRRLPRPRRRRPANRCWPVHRGRRTVGLGQDDAAAGAARRGATAAPARFTAPPGCASATSPRWRRSTGTSR